MHLLNSVFVFEIVVRILLHPLYSLYLGVPIQVTSLYGRLYSQSIQDSTGPIQLLFYFEHI